MAHASPDRPDRPAFFVYRSAETGEFVTREYAEANPATTVRERVPDDSAVPGEAFTIDQPGDPAGDTWAALQIVFDERRRQVTAGGWTAEHDDRHNGGELALAAVAYLLADDPDEAEVFWPWDPDWFKPAGRDLGADPSPADRVRELTKAGALLLAEIERIQREIERLQRDEVAKTDG